MFTWDNKDYQLRINPFQIGQILAQNSQITYGHIQALTYSTPSSMLSEHIH